MSGTVFCQIFHWGVKTTWPLLPHLSYCKFRISHSLLFRELSPVEFLGPTRVSSRRVSCTWLETTSKPGRNSLNTNNERKYQLFSVSFIHSFLRTKGSTLDPCCVLFRVKKREGEIEKERKVDRKPHTLSLFSFTLWLMTMLCTEWTRSWKRRGSTFSSYNYSY